MNKKNKNLLFIIISSILIIIFFTILNVPQNIKVPAIDDIQIKIQGKSYDFLELKGEEKEEIYEILKDLKVLRNPFNWWIPNNFYGDDVVTIFISGTNVNVPYHLTITCLPNGDSFNNLKPYAYINGYIRIIGNVEYAISNGNELFSFMSKFLKEV